MTAKCCGGDATQKRKLLESRRTGRRRSGSTDLFRYPRMLS
ncbi:hypothetical protein LVY65_08415 [Sphingomonas sp. G124]|uniref:Uncharacterized protein n=1 Tax=Sphingomonas cremea TaxID=2904799 RepID=A0A9X1QJW5_9SPHN|nr:hypothetical protein [Sphingomonas cremea]